MQKINFQNLPSTTTPINATNLNAIQTNVENVFNGSVPAGNMVVDSIRSKNMAIINKTTLNFNYYYEDIIICNISNLKSNTQYTISYDIQNAVEPFNLKIGYGNDNFDEDLATKENNTNGHITFSFSTATLPQKKYLYFRPCAYNNPTQISNCIVSNIQLEEGTTATSYAPYQELDNQENYSTNEIKIGTWINGKPIYRKVITFGSSSLNTITNHGISNIEFITNVYGILHHSYGWKPITTYYIENGQINDFFAISLYGLDGTNYEIRAGDWYTNGSVSIINDSFLVIEYTKTTD